MSAVGGRAYVAIDLGATSGRVILGVLDAGGVRLEEMARFANGPVAVPHPGPAGRTLHWDVLALWSGIQGGLRRAGAYATANDLELRGIGVDAWAVDYGLIDADGMLVANPRHYRDERTRGVPPLVYERISAEDHYRINGLQTQAFNTEFQLVAGAGDDAWFVARELLLVPDLFTYWLTGRRVAEVTNASTTGLLDVRSRRWSEPLLRRLAGGWPGLDDLRAMLPELVEPGTVVGALCPEVQRETGLGAVPVVAVASHDTASAVAAVPARSESFAYVSCGTWSLVGLVLDEPVLTEASRRANFTNELGLDGTVRYLRNVAGLWVLNECLRSWRDVGQEIELGALLREAEAEPGGACLVDVDGDEFLAPGDMPRRIAAAARRTGQRVPTTPGAFARAVLDSLAAAYARALEEAVALTGRRVDVVHLVGGGAQNALLCRLTAQATGLPVVAGPAEAAALGNVLVQARARGDLAGGPGELRRQAWASARPVVYEPVPEPAEAPVR